MSESKEEEPEAKFRRAVRQILSVPKAELERREIEYRKARKARRRNKRQPPVP
jgi:hypothetical protein